MNVVNTDVGNSNTWFLTEEGVYELLFVSRKSIAKEFKKWVRRLIVEIRLNSNRLLREKLLESDNKLIKSQKELEFYKEKTFEQVLLDQTLYTMSTDKENVFKVGKTDKSNAKIRKGQLQTGCVDDILILFEFKTSNCNLLENLVHYALKRYQSNSGREHFHCNLDYIKLVINICGKFVNTIGSMYQNITHEQFTDKISYNIPIQNIQNIQNTQIIQKVQEIKKPYVKYIKPTPFSIDECTQNTQDIIDELFPDLIQEISTTRNLIQEIS